MLLLHWKAVLTTALCAAACSHPSLAQVAPPTILTIDLANRVEYFYDVADPLKYATDPGVTTHSPQKNFYQGIQISDIVAVNGQPVNGIQIISEQIIALRRNPTPGQAIADFGAGSLVDFTWEFFKPDGTLIGTLESKGITNSAAPPYSPPLGVGVNSPVVIVGGSGAFLGARGTHYTTTTFVATRSASIAEDPSNRRTTPGGKGQSVIYLIPMERPEITVTANGPAVAHSSDFALVTASKPAAAGEILSLIATGLGPTVPGVNPGEPFPVSPLAVVNSPVEVKVNGKSAEVLGAVGYPGAVNSYQVNFRVPPDAASGPATIQVTAAWITGSGVSLPIR